MVIAMLLVVEKVIRKWPVMTSPTTTNSTARHAPKVKPDAATAVVELLMIGVRTPETC
jgi:hypothetical protein